MNYFDEDGDEILFHEFASKEEATKKSPKCPSCGITYHNHIGLNGTCKKLQIIFALAKAHFDGSYYSCTPASRAMCRAILELREEQQNE